jgi:hypothetical protein
MSNKKLNAAIMSAVLLLATTILVTPMKIANAQPQLSTSTNQSGSTRSINIDQQINDLKSKFPLLSSSQETR